MDSSSFQHSLLVCGSGGPEEQPPATAPPPTEWKEGDRCDVFDETTSIYCPCRIIRREQNGYLVKWLGWDDSYDSVVSNTSYILPEGTHVIRSKAWTRLPKKLGWWPCYVFIRFPKPNDDFGRKNLSYTTLMYVEPTIPSECSASLNRFKKGFWARVWDIDPFAKNASQKRAKGLCLKPFYSDFEKSLARIDGDLVTPAHNFDLDNSLCLSLEPKESTATASASASSSSSTSKPDTAAASTGAGKKAGKDKEEHSLKRKREPSVKAVDQAVCKAMRENVSEMKQGKVDLSWNIQEQFAPYFFNLEERYYQIKVAAKKMVERGGGGAADASSGAKLGRKQRTPVKGRGRVLIGLAN